MKKLYILILELHLLATRTSMHLRNDLLNNHSFSKEEHSKWYIGWLPLLICIPGTIVFEVGISTNRLLRWPSLSYRNRWFCYLNWWDHLYYSPIDQLKPWPLFNWLENWGRHSFMWEVLGLWGTGKFGGCYFEYLTRLSGIEWLLVGWGEGWWMRWCLSGCALMIV